MSERTIITTVEITEVIKNLPECLVINKKSFADGRKYAIKDALNADDVVVTNVQEFIGGAE